MAVTNEEINTWLQANAGASDADIAAAMGQYGVTPAQMAQATGLGQDVVQSRYDAAIAPQQPLYAGLTAVSTPEQIATAYGQYVQAAGGDTQQNQTQAVDYLTKLGVSAPTINQAYQVFSPQVEAPLYQSLTAQSTPEQIAAAYDQYTQTVGGDTQKAQEEAIAYLKNLGIGEPGISSAYGEYKDVAGLKPSFGAGETPTTEGILSGFKYATNKGLSEDQMKQALGEDVFNTYKTGFADYAKTGIANILADKKLSFDEAREAVKFGRDYGYDTQKLADLTGTNKKVFDAIYKNYDDTTNKIVDSVLGAEDVKTDGDKIGRALALQQKYGFTDEDLAKATDLSLDQVKNYLDPVKNFESDYKKLLEDPNRNEDKTKEFLTASMQNPLLREKFGDKFQPALDELNRPPRERMLDQIGAQQNALGGNYYQGVFSDPKTMVEVLERKGVKSLADLGQKEKFKTTKADAIYTTADGRSVQEIDGKFYVAEEVGDSTQLRQIPEDQVKAEYGKYETVNAGSGEDSYQTQRFVPLNPEEQATLKDGKYEKLLGNVVINKRTGEELTDTTRQLAYQRSGGGLKEKKNYLTIGFDAKGNAIPVATREKAGFGAALQTALPVLSMALPFILPGVGAALSSGLASAGGSALASGSLANAALTQGIISGGLGALGGQDFGKSFLGGAVTPVISSGIGSLLPTGMDPNIARAVTGAGTGVVKGVLQGGDFEDLLGQGVLSGLTNYGLGEATKGLNLTPQQLNFATGIALPLVQGRKVNPMNVIGTLAQAGQQAQKARP